MTFAVYITTALFFVASSFANAGGLPINPGLWESTVTMTSSFSGTQTKTHQECVVDNEFDPGKMMGPDDNCDLVESTLSGDTLTFTMVCNMDGGQGSMSGTYQSNGNTGSGTMNMEMSFGGQTMTMESSMTAQRVGDC